ncbi:hypothetical protein [Denitrobaculum tricleocarpae]|uniref:hypothetical protein n=1 Tax=Denitrobaculum tricleocarpae TaxID=2591009 RepID=UPI0015D350E0|nr:hypothetical protein [Denitrobaculum tricleocarpae]
MANPDLADPGLVNPDPANPDLGEVGPIATLIAAGRSSVVRPDHVLNLIVRPDS